MDRVDSSGCKTTSDRYIRDDNHLAVVTDYIEGNPVKAGLARSADAWRWGSAFRKVKGNPS